MSPWEELGIAPTAEIGAIRKAYAARLKVTRPEEDPAGFARLRAAYETALQMAPRIAAAPPPKPELTPEPSQAAAQPPTSAPPPDAPRPEPPKLTPLSHLIPDPPPPPANRAIIRPLERAPAPPAGPAVSDMALLELPPASQEAVRNVVDALNRKANFEAARLLYAACENNLLPLRTEFQLKDRLALALSTDEELRTAQLQEIASQFGWYSGTVTPSSLASSPQAKLAARLDRELAAERAEKAAAQPEPEAKPAPKPAPRPQPAKRWGGIGYGWIGFFLFILFSIGHAITDHNQPATLYEPPTQLAPSIIAVMPPVEPMPVDCRSGLSTMPIDALQQCADTGISDAQDALGLAYAKGSGLPQDYLRAVSLFRAASDKGHTDARRHLAYMERRGLGTPKDLAAARQLYTTNAEQGDVIAEQLLGDMLLRGEGGPTDTTQGIAWVKLAAHGAYPAAMADLGNLYAVGTGPLHNLAKAAAWRKAAAEAGERDAMYAYGLMLLDGIGGPVDLPEAYRWLSLAARKEELAAAARAALANPRLKRLSAAQRAAIDGQVTIWTASAPALPPGETAP